MLLLILAIILMLVGLAGVILPFLPGVPVAWVGMFLFAYQTKFEIISFRAMMIFLALTVLSVLLEFALPVLGAKKYKASSLGLLGAALGLIIGPFIFNLVGVIVGPLLGAIIGELIAGKRDQAIQSGWGTFVGFMVSIVLRIVLVLVMFGYLIVAAIAH